MTKYIIQQGTSYAPCYWNKDGETSLFKITDELLEGAWTDKKEVEKQAEFWNRCGKYKSVFKVIKIETES